MHKIIIVELAIHKKIIDYFNANPISDTQIISSSIRSEYDIMTLETVDYMEIIPTIQQFMPFIKVIMPVELDLQIREHFSDYDKHDLSKYVLAS